MHMIHQRPRLATSSRNPRRNVLSTGLFPSVADLLCPLNPPVLPRPGRFSLPCPTGNGCEVGGITMLGATESPMLEIRLRETKSVGLTAWLPFSGRGLTGLITPDMVVFGVGGRGLRLVGIGLCVCCNDAGTREPSGFGEGLLNSASSAFFWSEGKASCRSNDCCVVADGAGDCVKGIAG
jgi:hypothetical protein